MITNAQYILSYKFDKLKKNKVGLQMLHHQVATASLDGQELDVHLCALDCIK